jgi:aspartyl-tRNA(Asn)/glutamyl-tRNA(Gln) amidotransferase subunit B
VGASGRIHGSDGSIVDFNRGGSPLVEIVTEPDVHSAEQAGEWLRLLRVTLRQLGVSDVNMEEGSLRCDANVSVRPVGTSELGVKTELKNMNSFRFIEAGIRAEVARQEGLLRAGETVSQETLHYDPVSGQITSLRSKEEAHDYRYFPEPDLLPVAITDEMVARARAQMPELPAQREQRFQDDLGLSAERARALAFRRELGDFFEDAMGDGGAQEMQRDEAHMLANLIAVELPPRIGTDVNPFNSTVTPQAMRELAAMVSAKQISVGSARTVIERLATGGGDPAAIVAAENLGAIGSGDELASAVAAALAEHPDAAERMRAGNDKAIGPIVGHVMRATSGRADGGEVTRLVREQLGI